MNADEAYAQIQASSGNLPSYMLNDMKKSIPGLAEKMDKMKKLKASLNSKPLGAIKKGM